MKHRGLTIVEVLIGIVVIGIIAAIVIAVGGPVKRQAQVGTCYANLRNLHLAIAVYRNNYGGAEKLVGDAAGLGLPPYFRDIETGKILVGEREQWMCPAPKHYDPRKKFPEIEPMWWGNDPTYPPYEEYTAKYKGGTPLTLDFNHNNHAVININSHLQQKRILFLTLDGNIVDKQVKQGYIGTFHFNIFEID
jgi:prepilin-type N-terminal cleavage/methylation domain-containing protein